MDLDTSILQTKTVRAIVRVLKRSKGIAKENTRYSKGIIREMEEVIAAFDKAERKTKRGCPEVLSNRNLKRPYTLNL
jgi:hypothetical protein